VCGDFCGVKHCNGGELVVLAESKKGEKRSTESSMTDEVGILANLLVDPAVHLKDVFIARQELKIRKTSMLLHLMLI